MTKTIFIGICMPILVFSLLLYTCYQFVFNVQASKLTNGATWYSDLSSDLAIFLCVMSLLSYSIIMLKPANTLPVNKDDKPVDSYLFPKHHCDISRNARHSPIIAFSLSGQKGEPLYCQKCKSIKPERMHHCKECNRCAPKMDHHCIWINGCVEDGNYKYFFLFVFYVALYAVWGGCSTVRSLLMAIRYHVGDITLDFCWRLYKVYLVSIYYFWANIISIIWHKRWIPLFTGVPSLGLDDISFHWYILAVFGTLFGLTLTGFAVVHFYYIINNLTSIEYIANRPTYIRADFDQSGSNFEVVALEKYASSMFDLGFYQNWCSVMGSNPLLWFVPTRVENHKDNLLEKTFPYNIKFTNQILDLAEKRREARLNEDSIPCIDRTYYIIN